MDTPLPLEEIDELQVATERQNTVKTMRIGAMITSIAASIGLVLAVQENVIDNEDALLVGGFGVLGNLLIASGIRSRQKSIAGDIATIESQILHHTNEADILLMRNELESRGLRIEGLNADQSDDKHTATREWIADVVTSALHFLANAIP